MYLECSSFFQNDTKNTNGLAILEIRKIELIEENEFDAVLLDIMMPDLDGFAVCRTLRKVSDVPIIFLTALSAEEDKLYGYELGADDYVRNHFPCLCYMPR